jgi:hypothetical protein
MWAWRLIWKTSAVAAALVIGMLGANQVGWSGAELVVNAPIMGTIENFVTGTFFTGSALAVVGAVVLIYRLAKYVLWLAAPIFLYFALVPGVWNGITSDFDGTRGEALRSGYANAYAIEHMSARGRYRTCSDERIELTEDGKAACARALTVGPGEPIPGSEHRCGLLGMFSCFYTAPEKE